MTVDLPDSSVWIEYLRGRPGPATEFVDEQFRRENLPSFTEPIAMELLAGAFPRELAALETLLEGLPRLGVAPDADYHDAAAIYRAVRTGGHVIRKMNDCLIAAVAQRHGARVVHRDGDFEAIAAVTPLRTLDLR